MSYDRFQGDPKMILTENGVTLKYISGQPVMDGGFENQALISLLTDEGWIGNMFFDDSQQKIGSKFEKTAKGTITLSKLEDIRKLAEQTLANDAYSSVSSSIVNPTANNIQVTSIIKPKNQDPLKIILEKNGVNWINQIYNPAYRRV